MSSYEMRSPSKKSTEKIASKEEEALKKELSKIEKREFSCKKDAENCIFLIPKKAKYHLVKVVEILEKKVYQSKGRPKVDTEYVMLYYIRRSLEKDQEALKKNSQKSFYIVGTTVKKRRAEL